MKSAAFTFVKEFPNSEEMFYAMLCSGLSHKLFSRMQESSALAENSDQTHWAVQAGRKNMSFVN